MRRERGAGHFASALCPDEEGIKTVELLEERREHRASALCPDEEGIKTGTRNATLYREVVFSTLP